MAKLRRLETYCGYWGKRLQLPKVMPIVKKFKTPIRSAVCRLFTGLRKMRFANLCMSLKSKSCGGCTHTTHATRDTTASTASASNARPAAKPSAAPRQARSPRAARVTGTAAIMADAFADDPALSFIFPDAATRDACFAAMADPATLAAIEADEARLFDRSRIRTFSVEERASQLPAG